MVDDIGYDVFIVVFSSRDLLFWAEASKKSADCSKNSNTIFLSFWVLLLFNIDRNAKSQPPLPLTHHC